MIVGFNVEALEASRSEGAEGNLEVHYNPQIDNVEEVTVSAFEDKVAKIDFVFTVDYNAGGETAATIELEGNVLWKGQLDSIIDEWEQNQSLPEEIEAPLMNDLYRKCLSQAVGIADTLNLLPPIPTPRVDQT